MIAANNTALGDTTGDTSVANGASLALQGNITVAETLASLGDSGVAGGGALVNNSGGNTLSGAVTLTADAVIGVTAGALTLGGNIGDGINNFNIAETGIGTLTLSGANTYNGMTTVSAGLLQVNGSLVGAVTV